MVIKAVAWFFVVSMAEAEAEAGKLNETTRKLIEESYRDYLMA